ncbi:flavodoxin family protein [Acidocella aminolytica]|uniref:NAD(P)H dehydrogenase (Quinone) n=1 Tax=Acidocella aminolytica 101 = DSM 11237 TaxID=1120923 RepID=A0A0D6PJZ4_9PROT|nr:NAD(P)H-dependent oxidoreductase [Acidocella aminolytica]GAN81721.1 NAD(P)H dehydrogenase (quinone) [Acidocella aminolytica 101 = DSM 11237]SHF44060.1 Multimeric flavodoxin WrbA [Acidocella aminolytica 101 = DSM 11237]
MKRLLIVHYSLTGGTAQMAEAAEQAAAQEASVEIRHLTALEAGPRDMREADGYLFATPEMLAAMAGLMKDFFDRCYYPLLGQIEGRPYAAMICAGTDGTNAARQMARIATGWRLRAVAEPLILRNGAQTPHAILAPKHWPAASLTRCEELGQALAAGLALGVF